MRIYNAKNSQIDLPLAGNTRITVGTHSVSKDFMPSDEFLTLIAQTFDRYEIALIVSGPYEINMCAKNPAASDMVVQSLDEAISRFNPVKKEEKVIEEVKSEEPAIEKEEESLIIEEERETVEEPVVEKPAGKAQKKKNKKVN